MARIDQCEFGRIVADGRMRPDPQAIRQLQNRGLTVEALPTGQAVRRFGELHPANTAAALHLTC